MTQDPHLLFLYGTLMAQHQSPVLTRVQHLIRLLGPASFPGLMFDLNEYPGAIYRPGPRRIYGELYQIQEIEPVFEVLDEYEEASSQFHDPPEFLRRQVLVENDRGMEVLAWTYLLNWTSGPLTLIGSGTCPSRNRA